MSTLFFDTSALAKRYMPETGMAWVRKQTASSRVLFDVIEPYNICYKSPQL